MKKYTCYLFIAFVLALNSYSQSSKSPFRGEILYSIQYNGEFDAVTLSQ